MKVDSGWLIMVPIVVVLGSVVGLVLAIVPRVVDRIRRRTARPVGRALQGAYVTAYVGIGVWVHHSLGVSYARESASYARDLAADELICRFCMAPVDGRQGWTLLWIVAGLVAYGLRPSADNAFIQWWECRSADEAQHQAAAEHWVDQMLGNQRDVSPERQAPG